MRPRVNQSAVLAHRRQMRAGATTITEANKSELYCEFVNPASSANMPSTALFFSQYFPPPDVPSVSPMVFEAIVLMYNAVAMFLQHLHLYRSVFWLPHSYNSNAMNWYLIEWNIVTFSMLFLGRRLLWNLLRCLLVWLTPSHWTQSFVIVGRSLTTMAVLAALFAVSYAIVLKHPVLNLLYLVYPVFVYFLLFGLSGDPFLELIPPLAGKARLFKDKSGFYRSTYMSPGCAPNPEHVRLEVGLMKSDFLMRLKQVLFNSVCSAYYASFIPWAFAPSALHVEKSYVGRHVMLSWAGCFTLYAIHSFPASYLHLLHRTAFCFLGHWNVVADRRVSPTFYNQWSSTSFWPKDSFVRHGKDLFRAEGISNASQPGNAVHSRFYLFFRDVSLFSWIVLVMQSGLVLAQHISLTWSSQWYQLISEALFLFSNYYALFQAARDYLVFMRLNAAEEELLAELESGKH